MQELKLADLGEGMHEAEIVEWLVKVGDTVKIDQTVVKVETDKALVEIPSPVTGRVADIRVQAGQTAKVGDTLVLFETTTNGDRPNVGNVILSEAKDLPPTVPPINVATPLVGVVGRGARGATVSSDRPTPTSPTSSSLPAPRLGDDEGPSAAPLAPRLGDDQAPRPGDDEGPSTPKRRVLAAPAVRKLAFELGVDLEQVIPSDPSGRVSIDDVRTYAERAKTSAEPVGSVILSEAKDLSTSRVPPIEGQQGIREGAHPGDDQAQEDRQPLTGLRKRIAEHMERAWRTIPHASAFDEVDGTALIALRQALLPVAEKRGVHLTYVPLLIRLLLPVLKEFPVFNASFDGERREIIYKHYYHIGVATNSPEGLLVPVMRNADRLTLLSIATELERLIEGARKRSLSLPEVSGSTFTLNNVGSFGGSSGTPIINYPEVAILAVGKLQEKAIVQHGAVLVQPMMPLTLSFDHRLIDGAMAAAFLARFKELVENPQQLMLDML
jgi:pyruvate dehydrogenase E2 component (dihydrolipoamide acetyltransferase)